MRKIFIFMMVIIFVSLVPNLHAQIPREISYQGQLLDVSNEQPIPEGEYTLTFRLYNEANNLLWTEVHNKVFVAGGNFQVHLGSITPLNLEFNEPYFLSTQVGNDPEIEPRMFLASVPYSIKAHDANHVCGLRASDVPEPGVLIPLGGDGKFPASVLPGATSGDFLKKNTPDTSRANSTDPTLLVSNLGDGDGLNGRSTNGSGIAGRSDNETGVSGWTAASDKSGVFGFSANGQGVLGRSDNNDGVVGWTGAGSKSGVFGHSSAVNGIGVCGQAEATGGIGVYAKNTMSGNYAKLATDSHGLQVSGLARFDLPTGQINISTPGGWPGIITFSQNGHRRDIIVWDSGISFEASTSSAAPATGNGITINENGNVGIGTTGPDAKLRVIGRVKCSELELTAGSDLAEPFNIEKTDRVEPGMVLVIDPENPGKLKVAEKAYDRCVVGVISGAGGIKPGMLMSQEGSPADGEYPVALTGRVYCLTDATNNPVEAGDMLTTSDTPGYAMKVTDFAKAQGAILGKAMTTLEQGRGLVLVLVTLQ